MVKKKYSRLAKWVVEEATALKSLLTKKQVKRLKKAKNISVDQVDGCIYGIIFKGNSTDDDAQELVQKCAPRWFNSTDNIKKKDSTKEYNYLHFSCIEVALMRMSASDIQNLVDFLTDKQYELRLNPENWKNGKHGSVFPLA
jgi:hypothetical protein